MNFGFSNLLGAPYRGGNVLLSGSLLLTIVGNRVALVDLHDNHSTVLPFEATRPLTRLALSPNGVLLLAVDEAGRCVLVNVQRRCVLHHISFKHPVLAIQFSPDGQLIAVAVGKQLQIWRAPGLAKTFTPFHLANTFTGAHDSIVSLAWAPDSRAVLTGARDLTLRVFYLDPDPQLGLRPTILTGHRDTPTGVFWRRSLKGTGGAIGALSIARDGAIFVWSCDHQMALEEAKGAQDDDEGKRALTHGAGADGAAGDEVVVGRAGGDSGGGAGAGDGEEHGEGVGRQDDEGAGKGDRVPGGAPRRRRWANRRPQSWTLDTKHLFRQKGKLTSADYHDGLGLVVAGFSNGVFALYRLPEFEVIHLMSISSVPINTTRFSTSGEWIAFGCARLGQLLVWEWRSETYVLKQQGHYYDTNAVAYSPDGHLLATGADDAKMKVWNAEAGYCFVTFSDHTAPITAVAFSPSGNAVLSASLDGTVRAFDLVRYRNFRTLTSPTPAQFVSLAVDSSGEVICAGSLDTFEVFVWSLKTGRLVDILSGHEGPAHGLAFSPTQAILASSSWDSTVRLWDVFESKGAVETLHHNHDVLTLAFRPDGKQLAASTLDGQIFFWNPQDGSLQGTIEGRRDIAAGRMARPGASGLASAGKAFFTLAYSPDSTLLLAAGTSKYVCMYDVQDKVLLRRIQLSRNVTISGILDNVNSSQFTDAGPLDAIDDEDSDGGGDDALLPSSFRRSRGQGGGDVPGALPDRGRPTMRAKCLRMSPTGQSWAVATVEGVLIYTLDQQLVFDPSDLDMDVTPQAVEKALLARSFLRALLLSLRLNEPGLLRTTLEAIPVDELSGVAQGIPPTYLPTLIATLAALLETSPHTEFLLRWSQELCTFHGRTLRGGGQSRVTLPALRAMQKTLSRLHEDLSGTASVNQYLLAYLAQAKRPRIKS